MYESNTDKGNMPPVDRVRHEVDRWLDAVRTTGERAMETLGLAGGNRPTMPPVDVIELPNEIVVQIDLPGVAAETVDLSLAGNVLTIAANRLRPDYCDDARFHLRERVVGKYHRTVPLPVSVDEVAIRAEARDGQLTVTLKKTVPTPGRSIPVTRGPC